MINAGRLIFIFTATAVVLLSCKKDNTPTGPILNGADSAFVSTVGVFNYTQWQAAQIAAAKSGDSLLQAFATGLVATYGQAHIDLKTMGDVVGFTVTDTINTAQTQLIDQLNAASGRSFDSIYIHSYMAGYLSAASFYSYESANGKQINLLKYSGYYHQILVNNQPTADSIVQAY